MTADRTPVVLALLDDLVHQCVLASNEPDVELLHLRDGLVRVVSPTDLVRLWPPTEVDVSDADFALGMLLNGVTFGAKNERPMLVAVARRLADVAASLLVRGDAHRHEAAALWDAASHLLGLSSDGGTRTDAAEQTVDRLRAHLKETGDQVKAWQDGEAERRRERDDTRDAMARLEHDLAEARKDMASMVEQVAELTRQRDDARRERDEAVLRAASPSPTQPHVEPHDRAANESLRAQAIAAGATDCTVFVDAGQVTIVVDDVRHGRILRNVAGRVFASVPLLDARTYVVRTVGPAEQRQEYRSTPEARAGLVGP